MNEGQRDDVFGGTWNPLMDGLQGWPAGSSDARGGLSGSGTAAGNAAAAAGAAPSGQGVSPAGTSGSYGITGLPATAASIGLGMLGVPPGTFSVANTVLASLQANNDLAAINAPSLGLNQSLSGLINALSFGLFGTSISQSAAENALGTPDAQGIGIPTSSVDFARPSLSSASTSAAGNTLGTPAAQGIGIPTSTVDFNMQHSYGDVPSAPSGAGEGGPDGQGQGGDTGGNAGVGAAGVGGPGDPAGSPGDGNGFALGGIVPGQASNPVADNVQGRLTPGEGVLNNGAMALAGPDFVQQLNAAGQRVLQSGVLSTPMLLQRLHSMGAFQAPPGRPQWRF